MNYPVEIWRQDVESLPYSAYWNDLAEEQQKPTWIADGDFSKLEDYVAGFAAQLEECVRVAQDELGACFAGNGIELGAGILWQVPRILALEQVQRLYAVEYSRHRLLQLGPKVLEHYHVPADRVVLALGDMHDLKIADGALQFAILSAAFHHSATPKVLLNELHRVLRPGSPILILGEHLDVPRWPARLKARLPRWLTTRLTKSDALGDHIYSAGQYRQLFSRAGFESISVKRPGWAYQAWVLRRSSP